MKWPNTLTILRHGESGYNALKKAREEDERYAEFKHAYNRRNKSPEAADTVRALAEELIQEGTFSLGVGDHDTPLSENGHRQAEVTGRKLSKLIGLPEVILISPYDRTRGTHGGLVEGWPELGEVPVIEEERLREQEHGLALLYNDWRVFNVLHPEQDRLRELEGPYWYRYPQGENVPDARERNRSLLGTTTRDYSDKDVMWIGHHLSILATRANLERFGEAEYLRLDREEKPVNCGVTIYRGDPDAGQDGRLVLDTYNQKLY